MRSLKNDKRLALTIEDSTSDAYVPLIIKGSINIDVDVVTQRTQDFSRLLFLQVLPHVGESL